MPSVCSGSEARRSSRLPTFCAARVYDEITVPQAIFRMLDEAPLRERRMTIFGLDTPARFGITVTRREEWIRAAAAPPAVTRHLELRKGAPVSLIERAGANGHAGRMPPPLDTAHHAFRNVLGMNRRRARVRGSISFSG